MTQINLQQRTVVHIADGTRDSDPGTNSGSRAEHSTGAGSFASRSRLWYASTSVGVLASVVTSLVTMQYKFQQFHEFHILVPHLQFIDRVFDITVMSQRQVRTVPNCAEERRDSTAQFLGMVFHVPVVMQRLVPRVLQTVLLPCKCRSCSLSTAVHTLVGALRCRSCSLSTAVDVPVVAQRQIPMVHTEQNCRFSTSATFSWDFDVTQ